MALDIREPTTVATRARSSPVAPASDGLALSLLGGFELRGDGAPIALPASVERVVAYVALHEVPATRPHVAGSLWPDAPEERAMANLRSALWRLRRARRVVVETSGDHLLLGRDVRVDLRVLVSTAHQVLGGRSAPDRDEVERLASARELLGDWYDEWVLGEREHFRQLRLQALEQVTADYAAGGLFGRATETALAAVATEPLRESAHRALISVHLAQGNRSEAIRQYLLYRRLMRDELHLEPSDQMESLIGVLKPLSTRGALAH